MPAPTARPTAVRLRILAWHARPAAVVLALLIACAAVARLAAPPPPPTVPVVVSARDVAAGSELTAADLRVAAVPRPLAPAGAAAEDDVAAAEQVSRLVGLRVAVDVPRGLAVVDALLAGARFGVQPPPDTVVVPVRLDAAVTALLRPGDRVDLVAAQDPGWTGAGTDPPVPDDPAATDGSPADDGHEPGVLAHGALVLDVGGTLDADHEPTSGLTALAPAPDADPVALVAVTSAEGRLLAGAAVRDLIGAVLVP